MISRIGWPRTNACLGASVGVGLCLAGGALAGPEQSPALPRATIDLRTVEGLAVVRGTWRYTDAHIVTAQNRAPGADLKPSGAQVETHDIHPKLGSADFETARWDAVDPTKLEQRRTPGRLAFGWYRLNLTMPEHVEGVEGAAQAVLELVVDDYAEVWVNGAVTTVLGQPGAGVIGGWNAPVRVPLGERVTPGAPLEIAIFAANGPLSDPPANFVWIRSATLDFSPAAIGTPVETKLTRVDGAFDRIVSPGTRAEKLADGFHFTEGPVWVPELPAGSSYGGGGRGGYLLFSDPNKNVIHRWDPVSGAVSIFRTKSGYSGVGGAPIGAYHQPGSNGLTLAPDGRLTICEHGNRRVSRLEPNGTLTVLAERHDGKRFNSPNDLVYRSDGALFFTDPPFGLPKVFEDPRKELPHSGVYCLHNGSLTLVSTDLSAPNGLAFSPDERHLYVDNWDEKNKVVMRYDAAPDGTLSNGIRFIDLTTSVPGALCLDGLKVDSAGNVYLSAPDGVRVYSAQGTHLGTIIIPELPANFAFGDADRKTLYLAARTGLYRIRLSVPGK